MDEIRNIITMNDEDGNEVQMEFLTAIEYGDAVYAVFLPLDDGSGEVVILQVDESTDEEEYLNVEDYAVLEAVFELFKEKYRDKFKFTD